MYRDLEYQQDCGAASAATPQENRLANFTLRYYVPSLKGEVLS
jgi:hypothetical protein